MARSVLLTVGATILLAGCGGPSEVRGASERPGVVRHSGRVHQVLNGETVAAIAHEEGVPIQVIHSLNPGLGDGPLPVGTEVRLPVGKPDIRRVEVIEEGSR